MSLSTDAQLAIVDRLDELQAAHAVCYAALRRMAYLAAPERLKLDTPEEVLTAIRVCASEATNAVDDCTLAEQRRGMAEADADVMAQLDAAGGFQYLSDRGKLKALAAKKRAERDQRNGRTRPQADGAMSAGEVSAPVRSLTLHTPDTES